MRLVVRVKRSPRVDRTEALPERYDSAAGPRRAARHVGAIVSSSVVLHPRGDEVMVAVGVVDELLYLQDKVTAAVCRTT